MNLKTIMNDPKKLILSLGNHGLVNWMPDKMFLSLSYQARMGKKLNWNNIRTFNEKQQWLKLYDRRPVYKKYVDKYEVRKFVAETIGEEYLIPLIGVWDMWEEIPVDKLPNEFVIKCTHDSGSVIICHDKSKFDFTSAEKKIKAAQSRDFFWHSREWPYKGLKPRIIAEKLLQDGSKKDLSDYKLQCFNGKVDNILVCMDRFEEGGVRYYYFDREWSLLPYSIHRGQEETLVKLKPKKLELMIKLAEQLSFGVPELRVDFYAVNNDIYFGELTFFSSGGCDTTITEAADLELGEKLLLPVKTKN